MGILSHRSVEPRRFRQHGLGRLPRQRQEGKEEAQPREHAQVLHPGTPRDEPKKGPQEGGIFRRAPRGERIHRQVLHHGTRSQRRRRVKNPRWPGGGLPPNSYFFFGKIGTTVYPKKK